MNGLIHYTVTTNEREVVYLKYIHDIYIKVNLYHFKEKNSLQ